MKNTSIFLKVSAILWIICGLVHVLVGVMTMKSILKGDISASVVRISDAIDPRH